MSDRAIRLEAEVPGTSEQVWEAIATGPGISSWFVPVEAAGQEGGPITFDFGSLYGKETGVVTAWEPPRRFAYESPAEDERQLAYEWLVEARSGGTCVVRLVNSGFGSGKDWDDQYEGMTRGWGLFLDGLRVYLTHFRGRPCSSVLSNGRASGTHADAWQAMTRALGLPATAAEGEAVATAPGAPRLAGTVQRSSGWELLLLLDEPAPGYAFVAAEPFEGTNLMSVYAYFFGDGASVTAAREEPPWQAWMHERYPATKTPAGAA